LCTGTITERKRILELAAAAVEAQVPIWIVGKPYSETDPYFLEFLKVQRGSAGIVRYEGAVDDRARLAEIYRDARGFVLLSTMESHSLSAIEAAAAGCPLLLSDLPWARASFGDSASYCPVSATQAETARALKRFSDQAPSLPLPPKPLTWREVAVELEKVYRAIV
ncbi:MAG: glycosyltransferase, partial [Terrimicrobiaceae bacterium]